MFDVRCAPPRRLLTGPAATRGAAPRPHAPGLALAAAAVAVALAARGAAAQVATPARDSAQADTARGGRLDPVVVTAERVGTALAASPAAVTRLSAETLRRLPTQTVSAALELVPGIAVLQSDALGDAPRLAVRGFYGGGETEYVTVLLDGVPLTGLATGQVNWDLVPLTALEAIEVVRGGASSLYGDAAVGGVVNLITRRDQRFATWRASAGELGIVRAGAAVGGQVGGRQASVFGDYRHAGGYRDRERRNAGSLGASLALARGPSRSLTLSTLNHRRRFDEPGPLAESSLAASRRGLAPFFRFDDTDEQVNRLTLDGAARLGAGRRVTGYVTGEHARADAVRTVPLSTQFADTKERETRTNRAIGSAQLELSGLLGGMPNRLVVGTDAAAGRLASTYRNVVTGNERAYAASAGTPGATDASGRGTRATAAAFASWEAVPAEALRLTLGGRVDWIQDRYEPRAPSTGAVTRATRVAFSPRAGANLRYVDGARQTGHVYASAGRSFKAPTMDQLFDQRRTPVPFPPFAISTSNAALEAQYGTSVEAGAYHRVAVVSGLLDARFAVSAYQMDMKDELDFDLKSFRYVNLGQSRHRGVEAGVTLRGPLSTSAFANYTQQDATSRFGENSGRFLKAVPRRVLAAGLARTPADGLALAATATSVRDVFLDDANERRLDPYTRLDARASYPLPRGPRLSLNVQNLLGREYSTTGFPDPAGSGTMYLYPAAGRVVTVGLESRW